MGLLYGGPGMGPNWVRPLLVSQEAMANTLLTSRLQGMVYNLWPDSQSEYRDSH
jgi:hypothetical protein